MNIIKAYPPNYDDICAVFPIRGRKGIVFTYGSALYNPQGHTIPKHLMVHEQTHEKQQQEIGIKNWWNKYLADPKFRLKQELEAYRNQYRFIRYTCQRGIRRQLLNKLAEDLSGSMYGNILTFEEAKMEIEAGAL